MILVEQSSQPDESADAFATGVWTTGKTLQGRPRTCWSDYISHSALKSVSVTVTGNWREDYYDFVNDFAVTKTYDLKVFRNIVCQAASVVYKQFSKNKMSEN